MAGSVSSYINLDNFKSILGVTSTTDDIPMRKILESASRAIDSYTNRHFFITNETKYFDGAKTLWIPDLLSIDTDGLKTDDDGDGTFENTYATTDYHLYGGGDDGLNTFPKIRIEINPYGDYSTFALGIKRGVEITGEWGYGDGTVSTPYDLLSTLDGALLSTTITFNLIAGGDLSVGDTILVVDPLTGDEQMYITTFTPTRTLTVERGINRTTAVSHLTGRDVYVYRYPRDISQACMDLAVDLWQNRAKRGIQSETLGDYSYTMSREVLNKILGDSIHTYKRMKF